MDFDGDQGAHYYDEDMQSGMPNGMGGMGGMGGMPRGTTFKMSGNGGNIDPN